jgi:hypothetical protein
MKKSPNTVYIGYDPKENTAYEVLKFTIERIAVDNVRVVPIRRDVAERMGMYTREFDVVDGQTIDKIDGKPFSSEFSFTRFLVPAMNMYEGWALYMDSDMYLRTDINEIFEEYNSDYYPLYCVKHKYAPGDGVKMDGRKQQDYRRKNWSSLMLFNCGHKLNKKLTPELVNTETGGYLHGFEWLPDKDSDIGSIHEEWNWLDNHSPEDMDAKNVHFTTGGPWFKDWKCGRTSDGKYAAEWNGDYTYLAGRGKIKPMDMYNEV